MANVQIYQLDNAGSDLDNSALLAMDIPNPDSSAASEVPYVTRKESIASLETQMLQTDEYTTALDTTSKSIVGAINELKSGFGVDSANSPSAISVNGTYQIPQNVLDHTFIIVGARRAGRGGSVIFSKENLITFDNAFTLMADNNTGYTLKCSSTGLITLVSINGGLNEPYILVNGLL